MSLIADALDAAQRESAKRGGLRPPTFPDGPSSFRSVAKRSRAAIPRELGVALAAFAVVIVIVSVVSILTASSRNQVRPTAAASIVPPIPMPAQAQLIDTSALSADSSGGSSVQSSALNGFSAYDRAINEYEPVNSTSRTIPPSDIGADDTGEFAAAEVAPPPVKKETGSFKITMQAVTPAPVTDRFFQQGLAAQQRGDFTAARDFYSRSIAGNPGSVEAMNNLGAVYKSLGNLKAAEESYRAAIAIDPKFGPAWSNLAVVLDANGRRQDATAALQEALRLDPRNVGTKVNLAIQFAALSLYPEARRLLEEALRDNNTLAEAHYALGQVLERQGDRAQAINEYKAFLSTSRGRFPSQEIQIRQHLKDMGVNAPN